MSEPTVFQAWAKVMDEVQAVRKGDRNTQQNFNFRGIDAVVNAVGPALRKHGVFIVPEEILNVTYATVAVGQKQTPMRECTMRARWRVYGPAGDSFAFESCGEALDSGDKATAKTHSVAYRTALLQALCIPTDEPDPDSQTYERAPEPERRAERVRPTAPVTDEWTLPQPDDLNGWKRVVAETGKRLGMDVDALKADYAETCGGDLAEATPSMLADYNAVLASRTAS
jgi:hypothetical protein